MVDPGTLYAAVKAAWEAHRALDRFAEEHRLTRGEAAAMLAREAKRRADDTVTDLAKTYEQHRAWEQAHPLAAIAGRAASPALYSLVAVGGRHYWSGKPST